MQAVLSFYYLRLAGIYLRKNAMMSLLITVTIGIGVATCVSAYTILHVMSRDPIPGKSSQLFAVQVDNWGPDTRRAGDSEPQPQLSYLDANALLTASRGFRQVAMYATSMMITPDDPARKPFNVEARAASRDFFAMFNVPMLYGSAWSVESDRNGADTVVISRELNDQLFGGVNSVGRTLNLRHASYRIAGVMDSWNPMPRFYDVIGGYEFTRGEDLIIPFRNAVSRQIAMSGGYMYCDAGPSGDSFQSTLLSDCVWLQYWVELPTAAEQAAYRDYLSNYARAQQDAGRFAWAPNVRLSDVPTWLVARHVVPDDARLSALVAFGFLLVCLVNAVGLTLACARRRASEFALRRALGARRANIFMQCIVESALHGAAGGVLGIGLIIFALWIVRTSLGGDLAVVADASLPVLAGSVVLAILATIFSGLYPAWWSMRIAPATRIKEG